jgi:ABC-2 type transport system permease protein
MRNAHLRAYLRLTRAWLLGITRDRSTLFWTFAFPLLFMVLFGLAFGRSANSTYDIGVAVDSSSPEGQALVQGLERVKAFNVHSGSPDEETRKLKDGDLLAVVTLAPAPTAAAPARAASMVVVQYDPTRTSAQQIVLPIIRQVVDGVDRSLSGRPQTLQVQEQSVLSKNLTFLDFFLPGIIAFSIMQSGMFTAIPLVQLRVTRVLKRFGATPLPRFLVLVSQGTARLALALIQTAVLVLVARLVFGIHITSSLGGWLQILALILLGGATFLFIAFAVSGFARTEDAVPALVQAVSFPMMFLAGVFWPVDNFPTFIQPISRALPLTFLADGLRQVMVGSSPLSPLWLDIAALSAWLGVGAGVAIRFFKWE